MYTFLKVNAHRNRLKFVTFGVVFVFRATIRRARLIRSHTAISLGKQERGLLSSGISKRPEMAAVW